MRWLAGLLLMIATGVAMPAPASCNNDRALRQQVETLTRTQNEVVAAAVDRIQGTDRRLLALRSYVRSAASLTDRWSWSQAQIDSYRESDEYRDLLAEIDKVRLQFETDNPGFTLYANSEVRSLDVQVQRWNENQGVGGVAATLYSSVCHSGSMRTAAFRQFLIEWQPQTPSPLAAPGLSQHGRARAIDFQIQQGQRLVAGTDTAAIDEAWIGQGWSRKLEAAISKASSKFQGPLAMPDEPWHYEYRP
ncbi:hypothetical protein [Povalibacter sp.]|uniref:hypothetical protein n=1 Tax=Povalibacter sp. TaxID=1962978 RepID=UPI002F41B5EA